MEELEKFLETRVVNKHLIRYVKFIETRSKRKISKGMYTEKHHILPKSYGGSNYKDNIIKLTGREHYISHLILWKALGGSMIYAFWSMQLINKNNKYNNLSSRQFEELRTSIAQEQSKRVSGENHPLYGTHHSDETKKKIGNRYYPKGKENPNYGKVVTKETRVKMSEIHSVRQKGERNSFYGKAHSEETKRKQSEAKKGSKSLFKNGIYTMVNIEEVQDYLRKGYILKGAPKSRRKTMVPPKTIEEIRQITKSNLGITK